MNIENKILLNSKQVTKYLSISLRTLQKLSQRGKIKAIKIGRHWRYCKSDIEKYLSFGTDFSTEAERIPKFNKEMSGRLERRVYPRINTNFNCRYSVSLPPFKDISSSGIIKNISGGGVYLFSQGTSLCSATCPGHGTPGKYCSRYLGHARGIFHCKNNVIDTGDPIEISFIMDTVQDISAKGKVVRKDAHGVGIKFRDIDKEAQNKIISYAG